MLLDIAFGLFLGKVFSIGFLGLVFTLLPDIDFFFKSKKFAHRGILHMPIIYLLISLLLFASNTDTKTILAFIVGTMFHLFHDLFVLGRGIMIFYPFSKKRLKIFPDDGYNGYLKEKILWWDENSEPKYSSNSKNNLHNEHWIKVWYLRPNIFVITETTLAALFMCFYFVL